MPPNFLGFARFCSIFEADRFDPGWVQVILYSLADLIIKFRTGV